MNLFFNSFNQFSIVWITISLVLGGLIKYLFEQFIPELQRKKKNRIALFTYSSPLMDSTNQLRKRIMQIISDIESKRIDNNNNPFILNTIYIFGCFLGWRKIMTDEASQTSQVKLTTSKWFINLINGSNYKGIQLNFHLMNVIAGLSSMSCFERIINPNISLEDLKKASISSDILDIISGLMIKTFYNDEKKNFEIISLSEFIQKYENNEQDCKRWFNVVIDLFTQIECSADNAKWNRLIVFCTHLGIFQYFLSHRFGINRFTNFKIINIISFIYNCLINTSSKIHDEIEYLMDTLYPNREVPLINYIEQESYEQRQWGKTFFFSSQFHKITEFLLRYETTEAIIRKIVDFLHIDKNRSYASVVVGKDWFDAQLRSIAYSKRFIFIERKTYILKIDEKVKEYLDLQLLTIDYRHGIDGIINHGIL